MDQRSSSYHNDENRKREEGKKAWWQPAMIMFVKMSGWIVFPVILAVFLGKMLDAKLQTSPWGFVIIVGVAFLVSIYGLVRSAQREYKKIEEEENKNKDKDPSSQE